MFFFAIFRKSRSGDRMIYARPTRIRFSNDVENARALTKKLSRLNFFGGNSVKTVPKILTCCGGVSFLFFRFSCLLLKNETNADYFVFGARGEVHRWRAQKFAFKKFQIFVTESQKQIKLWNILWTVKKMTFNTISYAKKSGFFPMLIYHAQGKQKTTRKSREIKSVIISTSLKISLFPKKSTIHLREMPEMLKKFREREKNRIFRFGLPPHRVLRKHLCRLSGAKK